MLTCDDRARRSRAEEMLCFCGDRDATPGCVRKIQGFWRNHGFDSWCLGIDSGMLSPFLVWVWG
ncbi:hypothetical protein SAMN05519105_3959 [Rhodobacter sp. 24-YEA-8]|nr:hypothetical protein SAMN05519105_3959 [Rhodobacter sp. 24-YEA-8]